MKKNMLLKKIITALFISVTTVISIHAQPQYLTWDGGKSGTSKEFWSIKLQLPWVNAETGDWMDANQTPQGSTAYASANVTAAGPVNFNVKTLAARWLSNKLNRGFFLRSNQAWKIYFDGRNSATTSARPLLTITTDQGTFNAPCISNAHWSASTYNTFDSRTTFQVSNGDYSAIVQFDLSGVKGTTVTSAALVLNCKSLTQAGVINIFEANPPTYQNGGGGKTPVTGIAQGYALDKNLSQHPSVLFSTDFANLGKANWTTGSVASPYSQVYDAATQSTYLRGIIPKGGLSGCSFEHEVMKGKTDGTPVKVETELYARYYVYLENNWGSTVDANKMPGFDARMGWWNSVGYWQSTTGNGGSAGTGLKVWNAAYGRWEYEGHSERGHGGKKYNDGNPYDELFWIGGYMYHLDQDGDYGEGVKWNGTVLGKGKWYCIEHYMKMNSIKGPYDSNGNGTANYDGVYRTWVDGVLTYERTNFRWRRHAEMGIQGFWLNWYHGGTSSTLTDMNFRMNSVVIAREYIGPRKETVTGIDNADLQITGDATLVYPNPAKNEVNIKFNIPEAGNLKIKFFNALGQEVETIDQQNNYPAGEHTINLPTNDLPDGLYFLKLIHNNEIRNEKIIIHK